MGDNYISGNLVVTGQGVFGSIVQPAGSVSNASVAAAAGIAASKLEHQFHKTWGIPGSVADATIPLFVVHGDACTVLEVEAGSIVKAVGDAICTVDIKKNGTTILSAVITLNSSSTNRVGQAGTITVPGGVDGDLYEAVIDATIGTGTLQTGFFVSVKYREDANT